MKDSNEPTSSTTSLTNSCVLNPRIGLLGGSFDPPHIAHIALAQAALEQLQLDEVRFVVAGQPWQKPGASALKHRLRMTELALQDKKHFVVETLEAQRKGPTYTLDTLTVLRERYGAKACLALLMGGDQYRNLPTWHRHEELLTLTNLAVAQRASADKASLEKKNNHEAGHDSELVSSALRFASLPPQGKLTQPAGQCVLFVMPPLAVSSSEIRAYLRQANTQAVSSLLAPQVLAYSRAHFLYTHHA